MSYSLTADKLKDRIKAQGTKILEIESPWDLFKLPGFDISDLQPSLSQAMYALNAAKKELSQ